jgi:antitoxin MazE
MLAKVQKWGNSQGVRLPKQILRDARISVGDNVEVSARSGRIVVKPLSKSKFDLAELVSRMPRNYKPREEPFGKAVGKEEW